MSRKIIIGTANFGCPYGIRKKNFKKKVIDLCKFAYKKKVKYLDTSTEYFDSNKIVRNLNKKIIINTKILPNKKWINMDYCLKQFKKIKYEIGNKKLNTIYLHDEKLSSKDILKDLL